MDITVTHTFSPEVLAAIKDFTAAIREAGNENKGQKEDWKPLEAVTNETIEQTAEKKRIRRTKEQIAADEAMTEKQNKAITARQDTPETPNTNFDPMAGLPGQTPELQKAATNSGFDLDALMGVTASPAPKKTREECRALAATKAQQNKQEGLVEILSEMGVQNFTLLKDEQLDEFYNKVAAL